MAYSNSPILLRVAGGEWHRFTGEKARNIDYSARDRDRWGSNLEAIWALGSDEVKARRCDIEREMGGIGSVWNRKKAHKFRAAGGPSLCIGCGEM